MTTCKMVEGSVHIAADRVAEALSAVGRVHGAAGQGMVLLASQGWFSGAGASLRIYHFYGDLDERADATLSALAPYVDQDTTLVFQDNAGQRWRYLIAAGQATKQTAVELWRDVADDKPRVGGVLAPLVLSRDPDLYASWWANKADKEPILEALEEVADCTRARSEAEYALHGLMLAVFQDIDSSWRGWLRVDGLGQGIEVEDLSLDLDVAHDGDGVVDGVDVVLHLCVVGGGGVREVLSGNVYVGHAVDVFASVAVAPE
ncbi:hypothetical protein, partial [Mycobacteroides abscessus]